MESESGPERIARDVIDPARANALHATLGAGGEAPRAGMHLPPFWHHIYFWDCIAEQGLGRDGHPRTGRLIPDTGFPHRMWAGGTVNWYSPTVIGLEAEKTSTVIRCENKTGRSGAFAIVTLRHEIRQNGRKCIVETQDLIYRAERMRQRREPDPAPTDETRSRSHRFSTVMLFRYSAVTFNGHRIHYDPDFAKSHEGYPGLVVHGPLLALLLTQFAEDILGKLSFFRFRATSPVMHNEAVEACARAQDDSDRLSLWIRGPEGRLCMDAEAFPAPPA